MFYLQDVVDNLPVPAFTIGADKLDSDLNVLKKAEASVTQGARRIFFGRSIFMSVSPKDLVAAQNSVIKDGISPTRAVEGI